MKILWHFTWTIFLTLFVMAATASAREPSQDQLNRLSYESEATSQKREFFVYLPAGYDHEEKEWPVIFFLHGNGERGNGLNDLDRVLQHGPLREAWIYRRNLPFVIVSPQLPIFGESEAIAGRENRPKPARLEEGVPKRNYGFPSDMPIQRDNADNFPDGPHNSYDPFATPMQLPAGWDRIDEELILILDQVLAGFNTDSSRVYLTGLSMGGFGAFHMAAKYPDRWAAMAAIVSTGRLETAQTLADSALPIWLFGGGKDRVVKPHWLYQMAAALESAHHPAFRFTMHEDMDHDAWKRVYEGEDLFNWFLRYRNDKRPSRPEKSE